MRIKIKKNSIGFDHLKQVLVNRFPEYTFWELPKNRILVQKSRFIGCYISLHKKSIIIIGTFPSIRMTLFALLITIFGGIFIPLIIYYIFFYDHFKEMERKIGNFIKKYYQESIKK